MRRHRAVWIAALLPATLATAAIGVHASSAAPNRLELSASTLDKTFSCGVGSARLVKFGASVTLPPANGQPEQPGVLAVTTKQKTIVKNGATETLSQLGLGATKNSLRIDLSTCHRVKQQIPIKPKGLPGPPTTVTATLYGYGSEQCRSAGRVLIRLRLTSEANTPTHALLAVRNDDAKKRPIAFYDWTPHKYRLYTSTTCTS
jgi:hypothetical protein